MTPPQRRELGRLAEGPQRTYGRGRARVQNNLVRRGLARFVDAPGVAPRRKSIAEIFASYGNDCDWCEITRAGRAALKEHDKR